MKAKEYLNRVAKLDAMIENKSYEIERWKSVALGTTGRMEDDRVKSSGNQQKMACAIDRYADLEREVKACEEEKAEIEHTIERLDTNEYDVLHKVYFQGMTLGTLADLNGKQYGWATTTHGRALASLQAILDNRGN